MPTEYKATASCDVCTRKHLSCAMSYAIFARALDAQIPETYVSSVASLALSGGVGWARAIINFSESLNHDASLESLGLQGVAQYIDAARTLELHEDDIDYLPAALTDKKRYQLARLRRTFFTTKDAKDADAWAAPVIDMLDALFDYSTDAPETNFHSAVFFCVAHLLEAVREHTERFDSTELVSLVTLITRAYANENADNWKEEIRDALLRVATYIQVQIDITYCNVSTAKENEDGNV